MNATACYFFGALFGKGMLSLIIPVCKYYGRHEMLNLLTIEQGKLNQNFARGPNLICSINFSILTPCSSAF